MNKLSSKENRDRLTEMDRLEDNVYRMFTTSSKDEFDLAYEVAKISLDRIDVSVGTGIYVDNDEVSHMNYCPNCGARMVDTQESEG